MHNLSELAYSYIVHCKCDFQHGSPQLLIFNLMPRPYVLMRKNDLVTIMRDWAESVASSQSKNSMSSKLLLGCCIAGEKYKASLIGLFKNRSAVRLPVLSQAYLLPV